ncbi:glucan endo-1,3-beta-glucosidase GIV [Aegilops tauschii subsp. strangulata]|uniref:Glucan endo-1,3-beta-glucosidase GII n=2 Tax=Aegilops tauschii TaxID=37682 RepID=A0A453GLL5_AEGTS|nr:glucan endo-1,3-beta-glucosidase GIV [Aegilops tauschii subsp. strangulata]
MPGMRGSAPVLALAMLVGVFIAQAPAGVQSIGVCYGIIGNNLPPPSDVVQFYRFLGITNMRVYSVQLQALDALRGSGISLSLGTTNNDVAVLASSLSAAAAWVQANVKPYYRAAVDVRYISVGNELASDTAPSILAAMRNLNDALAAEGLGGAGAGIKVSTAVRLDVIANSFPPSAAVFAQPYMGDVARLLAATGAPLLANVYPYIAHRTSPRDIQLNYATFQPGATPVRDAGNGLMYTNLFDAMVDALYAALEKAGAPAVRVVVSETGWPSAGGFAATPENARAYNQGLIDHVARGTPKRPGPIEAYVFAMFNENMKPGDETERNFGLFYPNKLPVYPMRFA